MADLTMGMVAAVATVSYMAAKIAATMPLVAVNGEIIAILRSCQSVVQWSRC